MTPDVIRKCVLVRSGLELWIEADRADRLVEALKKPDAPRFISIDGQSVNTFEILGIFTADAVEERNRRKNGQWKCTKGNWHDKGQKCECRTYTQEVVAHVEGVGIVKYKK